MYSLIKYLSQQCINCLFPYQCCICHSMNCHDIAVCPECIPLLQYTQAQCQYCALPLPNSRSVCAQCLRKPPLHNHLITLGYYQNELKKLITGFKFQQKLYAGKLLAQLLSAKLARQEKPECLLPVPLHRKRLRQRGFNQSIEIAKVIKSQLNIPIDCHSIKRINNTQPQSELPPQERYQNVKNAFRMLKPIPYRHVAIVDDVITTGSTVKALSQVLKQAGVTTIQIWCLAKPNRGNKKHRQLS